MKKAFLSLLVILLVPLFLFGCGPSKEEHEKLKEEVEKLSMEKESLQAEKTELETEKKSLQAEKNDLESEVDKLILDSEGLMNKARSLYASERYEEAQATLEILVKTYPGSKDSKASTELTEKIDRTIEKRKAEIENKKQRSEATKRVSEKRKERAKHKKAGAEKQAKTGSETMRTSTLEKQIRGAHATKYMKTRSDNQKGMKWYHDKNSPLYTDSNSFQICFGMKKGSKPLLRLRVQHQGPDLLFVKSFSVVADTKSYAKDPAYFKRDKDNTRTWEWYDEKLTGQDIEMIITVMLSGKAKVILKGAHGEDEYVISSAEKESIRNVLDAYLEVGGKL